MKKKNLSAYISIIVLSLMVIIALSFCLVLMFRNASISELEESERQRLTKLDEIESTGYYLKSDADEMIETAREEGEAEGTEKGRAEVINGIQARLESGETTTNVVRELFKDKIVVTDAGRFFFFPINTEREPIQFEKTDLEVDENGIVQYVGTDPSVQVTHGIDVSYFQGKIDWKKVKAAGVDFAIIRVGNRGYSEGKLVEDKFFESNIKGALENDIDVGVYIFSQAINEEEAEEEAMFVLDRIEPYNIAYPVVIDIESADNAGARTNNVTKQEYTAIAKRFCEVVEGAGYTPMIYGNLKSLTIMMDGDELADRDTWFAFYGDQIYYPYRFEMWQYSSSGKVAGIEGNVDMNICVKRYTD